MSLETFVGSPIAKTLSDLNADLSTRKCPATCDIGSDADALHTSESRIVWIPAEGWGETTQPRRQEADGHVVATSLDRYVVSLYAPDFGALQNLYDDLRASLDAVLSPTAFAIETDKPKPRGGDVSAQGWGVAPTITIDRPVYGEVWRQGRVDTVTRSVAVTGDLDADPVVSNSL
jgi:hypothetical protein